MQRSWPKASYESCPPSKKIEYALGSVLDILDLSTPQGKVLRALRLRWALLTKSGKPTDALKGEKPTDYLIRSGRKWVDKTLRYVQAVKEHPDLQAAMVTMLEAIVKEALNLSELPRPSQSAAAPAGFHVPAPPAAPAATRGPATAPPPKAKATVPVAGSDQQQHAGRRGPTRDVLTINVTGTSCIFPKAQPLPKIAPTAMSRATSPENNPTAANPNVHAQPSEPEVPRSNPTTFREQDEEMEGPRQQQEEPNSTSASKSTPPATTGEEGGRQ